MIAVSASIGYLWTGTAATHLLPATTYAHLERRQLSLPAAVTGRQQGGSPGGAPMSLLLEWRCMSSLQSMRVMASAVPQNCLASTCSTKQADELVSCV